MIGQSNAEKNCKKGASCKGACIAPNKVCRTKPSVSQKASYRSLISSAVNNGSATKALTKTAVTLLAISAIAAGASNGKGGIPPSSRKPGQLNPETIDVKAQRINFSESGMTKIAESEYPVLLKLLNETYTDKADSILSAKIEDDGKIIAIAKDGPKKLYVTITQDQIKFQLLNPEVVKAGKSAGKSDFSEGGAEPDPVDPLIALLAEAVGGETVSWSESVLHLLETSDDLVDFAEKIEGLYGNLPAERFRSAMLKAMTAASMAGYLGGKVE
jgi:hypothetical protein